jgi:hypothetical protein
MEDPFATATPAKQSTGSSSRSSTTRSTPYKGKEKAGDLVSERTDELTGLIVGFAYALQYELYLMFWGKPNGISDITSMTFGPFPNHPSAISYLQRTFLP